MQDICLSSGVTSTWAERAGLRHSINGGTEEGSAAMLVFPLTLTSSPLLSAVGWRAAFGSDPICIYILPDCHCHLLYWLLSALQEVEWEQ